MQCCHSSGEGQKIDHNEHNSLFLIDCGMQFKYQFLHAITIIYYDHNNNSSHSSFGKRQNI